MIPRTADGGSPRILNGDHEQRGVSGKGLKMFKSEDSHSKKRLVRTE